MRELQFNTINLPYTLGRIAFELGKMLASDGMLTPAESFDRHYSEVYGERWATLRASVIRRERQVAYDVSATLAGLSPDASDPEWLDHARWIEDGQKASALQRDSSGLLTHYILDPASVLAAHALETKAGDEVLDLCAAPGGKSLVLLGALRESGTLIANELSAPRRERLKKVIQQYVPRLIRERVFVRGKDGTRVGLQEKNRYDRILLDAPCSGERHLLSSPAELARWSPKRTRSLARKQYALLTSALLALKPGGTLVYSTCALSPDENDGVIERLLNRKGDEVELDPAPCESPFAERTRFGVTHLPDRAGFGPLYFARLRKSAL